MPRLTDTKTRILDVAEELLQDRGFNGFSYQHVAEALGVKNAAIHYHFPTKGDLGVALIERLRRRFQKWAARVDAASENAADRLEAFFDFYKGYLIDQGKVCPAGILEAEFNSIPEEMREATRALVAETHRFLARTLQQGRDAGQLEFLGEADDYATLMFAALQGSLQIARATSPGRCYSVIEHLRQQLELTGAKSATRKARVAAEKK